MQNKYFAIRGEVFRYFKHTIMKTSKEFQIKNSNIQEFEFVLIVDTSYSMYGNKVDAINDLINNCINFIEAENESNKYEYIKLSILEYNDNAKWVYGENLEKKDHIQLISVGKSNINKAYEMLLEHASNYKSTKNIIYILISDGMATNLDWKEINKSLYEIATFKNSTKYAISLGVNLDEANHLFLSFTKNKNSVYHTYSGKALNEVVDTIMNTTIYNKDKYIGYEVNQNKDLPNIIKSKLIYAFDVGWIE